MNDANKSNKRKPHGDRVALNFEASQRVNLWLNMIRERFAGIRMRRSELVDWIVTNRPEMLSEEEISKIGDKFYDQMQLAEWVLHTLKKSRSRGEKLSMEELMSPAWHTALREKRLEREQPPDISPVSAASKELEVQNGSDSNF